MAEGQTEGEGTGSEEPPSAPAQTSWFRRPTVRALVRDAQNDRNFIRTWDARENDETRLPSGESVHLGGLVLTEAFTPSTVSSLFRALDRWPSDSPSLRGDWVEQLARGRGGEGGG